MRNNIVTESPSRYGISRTRSSQDDKPWLHKKFWTEEEYLALDTNHLIEFNNGVLEILPMPTYSHQSIAFVIARIFSAWMESHKPGFVVIAPFRMKTVNGKYREPDVIYLFNEHADKFSDDYWTGADIAVEVVSPGGKKRDWIDKRADYALTGISEYWIIDPKLHSVTVLKLDGDHYVEHGVFSSGQSATSALLAGLTVNVDDLFSTDAPVKK